MTIIGQDEHQGRNLERLPEVVKDCRLFLLITWAILASGAFFGLLRLGEMLSVLRDILAALNGGG